jgi:MFS family permease
MNTTITPHYQSRAWYRELNGYHWFVFAVASACWCFDCLDQRLFSLARVPALNALAVAEEEHKLGPTTDPAEAAQRKEARDAKVQDQGKVVTAVFLIGWGIGGLIFGALGDRHGRARMLTLTVLLYSIFTGLTFFSRTYIDFAVCRFITGVGVGGVFGLAVALIAETVPDAARTGALGTLQILSTIGNVAAAGFKSMFNALEGAGVIVPGNSWRWMFLVGAVPAFLVIFTSKFLREPEPWLRMKREGRLPTGNILAPYAGLLREERWRKNLIVGAIIASTGVIGLWAIGEYATDLQTKVFDTYYKEQGVPADQIRGKVEYARTVAYVLNMLGAGLGMWLFTKTAMTLGRRVSFAIGFSLSLIVTMYVYWKLNTPTEAYWMMFLLGVVQLAVFAGFAIYLPELFPSRLRSTGTSFCYNLGRFAAAAGSLFSAQLASDVFGHYGSPLKERYSAMTMCAIFLMGLAVLPFAPETKGQPLPE